MHNSSDKCMYSKFTKEYRVIVCLYVDDMLIFGMNMKGICETKKYFSFMFQMKDLNEVDTILESKLKDIVKDFHCANLTMLRRCFKDLNILI